MKTRLIFWITSGISGILLLITSGCYTRLQSMRAEEGEDTREYTSAPQDTDRGYAEDRDRDEYRENGTTVINNYYDDGYNWSPRSRIGFSYYYPSHYWPSYSFSVAYTNPWAYDSYWAYDPWWCGTPYIGYSPYYPPYNYPYYGYSNYNAYPRNAVRPLRYGARTVGSTRGEGERTVRASGSNSGYELPGAARSTYDLPTGTRINPSAGASSGRSAPSTSRPRSSTRREGSRRGYTPRSGGYRPNDRSERDIRGSGSDYNGSRGEVRRETQTQSQPPASHTPPASAPSQRESRGNSGSNRGTRDAGSSRGNAPSYAPPPPPPAQSAPPPSRDGGSRKPDGNSRGGNARGGRP